MSNAIFLHKPDSDWAAWRWMDRCLCRRRRRRWRRESALRTWDWGVAIKGIAHGRGGVVLTVCTSAV